MNEEDLTRTQRIRRGSVKWREQQKEGLRRAILDAAGELFLEHGKSFTIRTSRGHMSRALERLSAQARGSHAG